jgi:hypothetical protein
LEGFGASEALVGVVRQLLGLADSVSSSENGVRGELEEELEPMGGRYVVRGGKGDRTKAIEETLKYRIIC